MPATRGRGAPDNQTSQRFALPEQAADGDWLDAREDVGSVKQLPSVAVSQDDIDRMQRTPCELPASDVIPERWAGPEIEQDVDFEDDVLPPHPLKISAVGIEQCA
jgi:hypothetical protein